jgi:hypothetical protein
MFENKVMNDEFSKIFVAFLKGELVNFFNQEISQEFVKKNFNYYSEDSLNIITLSLSRFFSEPFSLIFNDSLLTLCISLKDGYNCTIHCLSSNDEYQLFTNKELEKVGLNDKFDQVYTWFVAIKATTQTL